MACVTAKTVGSATRESSLTTRDTVVWETPASLATSVMVLMEVTIRAFGGGCNLNMQT